MPPNQGHEAPDASWELTGEEAVTAEMVVEEDELEDEAFSEEGNPRMGPEQSMLLLLTQSEWQVCPLSLWWSLSLLLSLLLI